MKYYGFNPPFFGGGIQNVLSRQEDEQLIKNDVLQLLLTLPGERVHRPKFGTPLRSFVFENSTSVTALRARIISAIQSYEQRINVVSLNLIPKNDNLLVILVFNLKSDPKRQFTIERFVNQNG